MFIILRLWIDTMENCNAYGFDVIGYVDTKEEAERITSLGHVPKALYPWPLKYAWDFNGDTVPRFIVREIVELSGMRLDDLLAIQPKIMLASAEDIISESA